MTVYQAKQQRRHRGIHRPGRRAAQERQETQRITGAWLLPTGTPAPAAVTAPAASDGAGQVTGRHSVMPDTPTQYRASVRRDTALLDTRILGAPLDPGATNAPTEPDTFPDDTKDA